MEGETRGGATETTGRDGETAGVEGETAGVEGEPTCGEEVTVDGDEDARDGEATEGDVETTTVVLDRLGTVESPSILEIPVLGQLNITKELNIRKINNYESDSREHWGLPERFPYSIGCLFCLVSLLLLGAPTGNWQNP